MPGLKNHSTLRSAVLRHFREIHACPVENGYLSPGMPDINVVTGWIELKWTKSLPKHDHALVISSFRAAQLKWVKIHHQAGGRVWGMLYSHDDTFWILIDVVDLWDYIGVSRRGMFPYTVWNKISLCSRRGSAKTVLPEFLDFIKGRKF